MSHQKITVSLIGLMLAAAIVAAEGNPVVVVESNFGNIRIELLPSSSPISVANFLEYVEDGFYEGTVFHRVEKGVLIQGGGLTPGLQQKKAREPIKNEAMNRVKNEKGTVAMARAGGIHTSTAQFFINTRDNREYDHKGMSSSKFGYAVFGIVIEGMDVVELIENIKTTKRNGMRDVPSTLR